MNRDSVEISQFVPMGVPKPGCFKPGCLQFPRGSALLHSFAPFCALLRTCICALLRSCALFAIICAVLRPTAFRATASPSKFCVQWCTSFCGCIIMECVCTSKLTLHLEAGSADAVSALHLQWRLLCKDTEELECSQTKTEMVVH